ncbi:hypothetical protein ACA910_011237 [Epithemia clementina (nom. ined.)]
MSVDTVTASAIEPPMPIQPNEFSLGSFVLTDQDEIKLWHEDRQVTEDTQSNARNNPLPTSDATEMHLPSHDWHQEIEQDHSSGEDKGDTADDSMVPIAINLTGRSDQELPFAPPVDYGLEPVVLSAGSIMSVGTIISAVQKLEGAGLSFGSVMTFSTVANPNHNNNFNKNNNDDDGYDCADPVPGAVDCGLEDIGTSFGSMTIGTNAAAADMSTSPVTVLPPPQPAFPTAATTTTREPFPEPVWGTPMLPPAARQQRSKGSLLECSDTESEDEDDYPAARSSNSNGRLMMSARKSSDWERLKATFLENQMHNSASGSGAVASFSAPPPLAAGNSYYTSSSSRQTSTSWPGTLNIPTTSFGRDVSQMSAMSGSGGDEDAGNLFLSQQQQQQQLPFQYGAVPQYQIKAQGTACGTYDHYIVPSPPAAIQQQSDDWHAYEASMLNRGTSLAYQDFAGNEEYQTKNRSY